MARQTFVPKSFKAESEARIEQANAIIADYMRQGLTLTLRQLYYQFVTRNWIRNEKRSYQNLSALLNDARLAGRVDWEAIEDRVRRPRRSPEWGSITDLVNAATSQFRLPRWEDQPGYAELWVEKDALAGVLDPLAREYHVTLMVNRGYSSASAMYDSANRFKMRDDKECVIFYLGDFDPSGEDMVRDIRNRMEVFGANVRIEKIALTPEQIAQYRPPPNPAKMSDPRAAAFVEKNGRTSYEVDALPPDVLQSIIRAALDEVVDRDLYDAVIAREEEGKKKLKKAASKIEV